MRLIDADELKKECYSVPDPRGRYAELRIIEDYEIDDAPTIFEISDNATNGDVIKVLYPNADIEIHNITVYVIFDMRSNVISFDLDWWNAPYQKGGK